MRMEHSHIESLASLDLAALLRVFDQNWYHISKKLDMTTESRHFVKEMQTVRNRWAHAGTEGFPVEDVYRDLDTIQRLAKVIDAEESFLQEVRDAKTSLVAKDLPPSRGIGEDMQDQPSEPNKLATEYKPGQIVQLKSNPAIKGAIVSVLPGTPENRFMVFVEGETRTY